MDGSFSHSSKIFGSQADASEGSAITLLMRDGSRMALDLADPWRQAPELARGLASREGGGAVLTLDLADGSRLMLSSADILGLHLPPDRAAVPALPAGAAADGTSLFALGARRVMRIQNFLPDDLADRITEFALAKEGAFEGSKVLSNDPEYRRSSILYNFQPYEGMFRTALGEAFPPLCETLGFAAFDLAKVECQLTATLHGGYFKPHNDNAASLSHRRISYVYYFHRQPRPFQGGELRFFDYNPFAAVQPDVRNTLDMAPAHNSIVFFDSSCMHEVREVVCADPSFASARFTINGWLSNP